MRFAINRTTVISADVISRRPAKRRLRRPGAATSASFVVRPLAVFIAVGLIALLAAGPAVADQSDLYRLFDVDKVGADVVIAVDTSLSMKESWPAVNDALKSFNRALQGGDRLTVVVFDNRAKRVYRGPARSDRVRRALPDEPDPKGLRTDIGAAVEEVLKELRTGGSGLPVVVFLTDGTEDPPDASRFVTDHDRAWSELREKVKANQRAKGAYVHAIGLNKNTDINKIRGVWPGTKPLTVDPQDLAKHFVDLKKEIRRERLRRAVAKEMREGRLTIEPENVNWGSIQAGASFERVFTVTSTYKHLPIVVTLSGAGWETFESMSKERSLAGRLPKLGSRSGRIIVNPGAGKKITLRVKVPQAKGRLGLRKDERYRGRVRLNVAAAPRDEAAIAKLGTAKKVDIAGRATTVWFYRPVGQSIFLLGLVALAALTAVAVFWRQAILPTGHVISRRLWAPPLFGRLAFSGAPPGAKLPGPVSLENHGRHATIGSAGDIRLSGADIKTYHAELSTQWIKGEPQVMIRGREGAVRVAASSSSTPVLAMEAIVLKPGSVIQIGEFKIQWI